MTTERDIWASARALINARGEDAATEAAMSADRCGLQNDRAGMHTWQRIMTAIEWLQDRRGRDPFKVEH